MQNIIKTTVEPGGVGYHLKRTREIEDYREVDILFLGSSHAYRSFDPRIFTQLGLTTFNLGSSAQTPLNSYFLLRRYFKQLKPKLIVYELFFWALSIDGVESFYDITVNSDFSWDLFHMALATRKVNSLHFLVGTLLNRIKAPLTQKIQKKFKFCNYVPGGYVESIYTINPQKIKEIKRRPTKPIVLKNIQLKYLQKIIDFSKSKKIKIALVSSPMTKEFLDTIGNFKEIVSIYKKIAKENNIRFIDFNHKDYAGLVTFKDFLDHNHLNYIGVKKFSKVFLDWLFEEFPTYITAGNAGNEKNVDFVFIDEEVYRQNPGEIGIDDTRSWLAELGIAYSAGELKRLKKLDLSGKLIYGNPLAYLKNIENLEELIFAKTDIYDAALSDIGELEKLKSINLAGTIISDESVKYISRSKRLEYISFTNTRISDNACKFLGTLDKLKLLSFKGTKISDNGLRYLEPLSNLVSLNLSKTGVTDKGLKYLTGFKKLEILILAGTRVSPSGIKYIKSKLPGCVIKAKPVSKTANLGGNHDKEPGKKRS